MERRETTAALHDGADRPRKGRSPPAGLRGEIRFRGPGCTRSDEGRRYAQQAVHRVVRCPIGYDAIIGVGAAMLTSLSHWPQLKKCWQTGRAEDLSVRAFVILAVGVALWLSMEP